jgi:hypothetical protein
LGRYLGIEGRGVRRVMSSMWMTMEKKVAEKVEKKVGMGI